MSQAHLHLVITHLPIFGSILGAIVLGYGLLGKSDQTKIAAYFLFIISGIGAGIAYLTGEGAEEAVENVPGVSENMIKQHENFAMYALVGLIGLAVVSLFALIITYRKMTLAKTTSFVVLLISLISFSLVAWTGYLGGQIRHTEITNAAVQGRDGGGKGSKDDD